MTYAMDVLAVLAGFATVYLIFSIGRRLTQTHLHHTTRAGDGETG